VQTRRFHVIGDPIAHSLSPAMHAAALRAMNLPHTYEAMRVTSDELPAVLDRVRRGAIHGLNVTVPHKVAVLALVDVTTDACATTGAANTVWLDETGRLVGANTDVEGLRADLAAHAIAPRHALVLGAGGAARAAVMAIATLGAEVSVAARRDDEAHRLARDLHRATSIAWTTLADPRPFDLVINATSAGMAGGAPGDAIADAFERAPRTPDAVAYDLVYRSPPGVSTTPFLARAAALGHRGVDGLGMLVEQGARALSLFLGGAPLPDAARDAMRRAVQAG
jgi:shikimate dehydrogenase